MKADDILKKSSVCFNVAEKRIEQANKKNHK